MYIIFGEEIVDSEEIKKIIEENSNFKVDRDMCKGTKREDVVAYQLSIPVKVLNEKLDKDYDLDEMSEEDLFEEYINLSEEMSIALQDFMPKHSLVNSISYKWDNSSDVVKTVFTMAYIGLGQLKLNDVSRRLLNELD
ncbi:MAG TPA: hypothetical protein DDY58_02360 [Terrisporobacter glycolicus]|uniref:Uncharacterized protein n=2 Tax=Terrisporobacter TaxID=1505652 RepID=A0ABZ3F9V0_9FIRM|nr:hypothetical protein [Terrisporobacter sp.]MBN9649007.1 hypothetical protein [Terrisporobacter glycolicus]UPA30483.1 hypothetical protein L0P85_18795 [Terrisporobacter glycolicus]SFJ72920.1 hypothetical protein SAMN02910355_3915 [Terrisporobacter glycolicus]HBI91360.1 hypothetical protein [Terrisporobacter hibernicus]